RSGLRGPWDLGRVVQARAIAAMGRNAAYRQLRQHEILRAAEAPPTQLGGRFAAPAHPELAQDAVDMVLDRRVLYPERSSYLLVRQALAHQRDDLALALREHVVVEAGGRPRGKRAHAAEKHGGHARRTDQLTANGGVHRCDDVLHGTAGRDEAR